MTFLVDISTIFERFVYNWLHNNTQCNVLCFLKLNIGNEYGLCSVLKKRPGIVEMVKAPAPGHIKIRCQ
jgi:hypothetical protein